MVLLVEDEFLLREELAVALGEAGFAVLSEATSSKSISLLKEKSAEISALVTDINLSDTVSGWDVARKAREINPQLPVIYTTSYNTETWAANGVPNSVHILKPFVPVQVITALANLLNTSGTPAA